MTNPYLPIYNLKKAVGPHKLNRSDDVKLLSSLLADLQRAGDRAMQGIPAVQVTMAFTPALAEAIEKFQMNLRRLGVHAAPQESMDIIPGRSSVANSSRHSGPGADRRLVALSSRPELPWGSRIGHRPGPVNPLGASRRG